MGYKSEYKSKEELTVRVYELNGLSFSNLIELVAQRMEQENICHFEVNVNGYKYTISSEDKSKDLYGL